LVVCRRPACPPACLSARLAVCLSVCLSVCLPVCLLTGRHTDSRQTDRQTGRQTGRQADRQTGRQTDRQTDRQADRQAGKQAYRQTDRQTAHSQTTDPNCLSNPYSRTLCAGNSDMKLQCTHSSKPHPPIPLLFLPRLTCSWSPNYVYCSRLHLRQQNSPGSRWTRTGEGVSPTLYGTTFVCASRPHS
jgi:hypothetical protein